MTKDDLHSIKEAYGYAEEKSGKYNNVACGTVIISTIYTDANSKWKR